MNNPRVLAKEIDTVLHAERLEHNRKRLHVLPAPIDALPDGTMVVWDGAAFTLRSGQAFRWTEDGYGQAECLSYADALLTPPSTLRTLRAGYQPVLHPSINASEALNHA